MKRVDFDGVKCGHCEGRAGAGPPRTAQVSGGAQDTWWWGALGRSNSHSLNMCVCVCVCVRVRVHARAHAV